MAHIRACQGTSWSSSGHERHARTPAQAATRPRDVVAGRNRHHSQPPERNTAVMTPTLNKRLLTCAVLLACVLPTLAPHVARAADTDAAEPSPVTHLTAAQQPASSPQSTSSNETATSSEAIEEVIVSGEQPGPSLWRVSKGDHVMWVLGTIIPLPKKMTWRSREVESVISRAQEIIAQETVSANIGFFRGMRLLPAALRARRNPDGAELKEILSPDLYARWSRLKLMYIGKDKGVESWRPMFAGFELYGKALDRSGLARSNVVWPTIRQLAKKHNVRVIETNLKIDIDDPRGLIRDFTETPRDADIACLAATIDRLETDLEPMKQRASAWAIGDVETLQRLITRTQETTCLDAVTSTPRLQDEYRKVRARALSEWMALAERAIASNEVTLAILPMTDLLSPTGRLSQLQAKGYVVEKP
jgi:uncharacterized protein YbaP (TraB family)